MKISVRTGCFETNSSSMHSVAVVKDLKKFSPLIDLTKDIKVIGDKEYFYKYNEFEEYEST